MTRSPASSHRQRLAAIPSGAFMEVFRDGSGSPEYMDLSLLGAAPSAGLSAVLRAGTPQALSDTGAVQVTQHKTNWSTTGAATGTMADGTVIGQVKVIQMIADLGDAVLTPSNFADGTTITFADVGDTAELIWDGTNWNVLDLYNRADGATAPVVA